jgi:hypothetical protein
MILIIPLLPLYPPVQAVLLDLPSLALLSQHHAERILNRSTEVQEPHMILIIPLLPSCPPVQAVSWIPPSLAPPISRSPVTTSSRKDPEQEDRSSGASHDSDPPLMPSYPPVQAVSWISRLLLSCHNIIPKGF